MDVRDYLLDQSGLDWQAILSDWQWVLPKTFTIWLVNRYGDLFLIAEDGSIQMLDLSDGSLKQLASDREEFVRRIDEGDNANQWLMIPLVDRCTKAGLLLSPGKCYSYVIPPILGGEYTVENTEMSDIAVHFSLLAQIQKHLKDLPDGTRVKMVVGTSPAKDS